MSTTNEIEILAKDYIAKVKENIASVYPFMFEMAWCLYGKKGDKDKAFAIWNKEDFDKDGVLSFLFDKHSDKSFKKEDLRDFEDFLSTF